MVTVKILGPGCANCKKLESIARQVIEKTAVEAEIIKVTDFNVIGDFGVVATPGLVINEKVVSSGRIPTSAEVTSWIAAADIARG